VAVHNLPLGSGLKNRVQYSVLKTLFEYHEELGMDVPYLTTIIVNNDTGLPTHFSKGQGWSKEKIWAKQQAVYEYEHWEHVRQVILQD